MRPSASNAVMRPEWSFRRAVPTLSWDPRNTYNLWQRVHPAGHKSDTDISLTRSNLSLFQQKWLSKRLLKGYHAGQISTKKMERWFIPHNLPVINTTSVDEEKTRELSKWVEGRELAGGRTGDRKAAQKKAWESQSPVGSMLWRDTERRLDTLVFRACFANGVWGARGLILAGKVKLNGQVVRNTNVLLEPGDIFTVDPKAIFFIQKAYCDSKKLAPELEAMIDGAAPPDNTEAASPVGDEHSAVGGVSSAEATPAAASDPSTSSDTSTAESTSDLPSDLSSGSATSSTSDSETPSDPSPSSKHSLPDRWTPPTEPIANSHFHLPDYASPHIFVPAYLLPNYLTCSAVYVRHPTVRPGYSEIPSPYDAGGMLQRLAWEYYRQKVPRVRGRRKTMMDPQRTKDQWQIPRPREKRVGRE